MATPAPRVSENPIVQEHYAVQLGLAAALARASGKLSDSSDYTRALASLVREFQSAAAALSADYYTNLRDQANVPGTFRPPLVEPWPEDQMAAYFETAVKELVDEAERRAQAVAIGQNLTSNAGIDEIFASIDADPRDVRWARVTRPGACSLCLLAAVRGAVYRTETSASFRPHMRTNGRGGNCQCTVEPSFTKYEPAAHIRQMQSLYAESTDGFTGSKEKQNAFRRALYADRSSTR